MNDLTTMWNHADELVRTFRSRLRNLLDPSLELIGDDIRSRGDGEVVATMVFRTETGGLVSVRIKWGIMQIESWKLRHGGHVENENIVRQAMYLIHDVAFRLLWKPPDE